MRGLQPQTSHGPDPCTPRPANESLPRSAGIGSSDTGSRRPSRWRTRRRSRCRGRRSPPIPSPRSPARAAAAASPAAATSESWRSGHDPSGRSSRRGPTSRNSEPSWTPTMRRGRAGRGCCRRDARGCRDRRGAAPRRPARRTRGRARAAARRRSARPCTPRGRRSRPRRRRAPASLRRTGSGRQPARRSRRAASRTASWPAATPTPPRRGPPTAPSPVGGLRRFREPQREMSAWSPQAKGTRSKRGSRSESWPRHQSSISSTSAEIRGASLRLRSAPSAGVRVDDADRAPGERGRPVPRRASSRTTPPPPRVPARRREPRPSGSQYERGEGALGESTQRVRRRSPCPAEQLPREARLAPGKQAPDVVPVEREDPEGGDGGEPDDGPGCTEREAERAGARPR